MAKPKIKQAVVGRSLRSFRLTKTHRAMNRYLIYTDSEINQFELPRDLNDTRNFVYTLSLALEDAQSILPLPVFGKLNRYNLAFGRAIGDFNALKNTLEKKTDKFKVAGVGERAIRRAGGKVAGKVIGVIPAGHSFFGNVGSRSVRSVVGANATITLDRMVKKLRPGAVSTRMIANFDRMNMQSEDRAEALAQYIFQKIGEKTPRDSDRLINSLTMRKTRSNSSRDTGDYMIKIGNVKPMPDPNVPYPWVVEFGINKGFNKETAFMDSLLPIPSRFQFLRSVTGPRPDGDTFFGGFYNNDNRGPFDRSKKNTNKGAMVRRALYEIYHETPKYNVETFLGGKFRTNPFKEAYDNNKIFTGPIQVAK